MNNELPNIDNCLLFIDNWVNEVWKEGFFKVSVKSYEFWMSSRASSEKLPNSDKRILLVIRCPTCFLIWGLTILDLTATLCMWAGFFSHPKSFHPKSQIGMSGINFFFCLYSGMAKRNCLSVTVPQQERYRSPGGRLSLLLVVEWVVWSPYSVPIGRNQIGTVNRNCPLTP